MEVISGIISGILLLTVLVTFPLGIRARRRTLKEIAELGSQLEEKTKSLIERVESLVEEEKVVRISAGEAYPGEYRRVDIKGELREAPFIFARDLETKLGVSEIFLRKSFVSFAKSFFVPEREEYLKVFKMDIAREDVEEAIAKGGNRYFFPPRYSLVDKERVYAR